VVVRPGVTNVTQFWGQSVTNGAAAVGPSGISGLSVQSSLNRISGQVGHLSGNQMKPSELSKQNVLYSVDEQYGRYGPAVPDASGVHDVKHDSVTFACNDDVSLPCDFEVVFARQKCVTSDYLAGNNADLNDFVDAEIRRLEEQTAKLKRQMAQMKRGDDTTGIQLVFGSRRSSRAASPDLAVLRRRLQFSTARHGDEQPSAAHLDMPLCDRHGVAQAGKFLSSTLRRHVAPRHDNDRQSSKADRFSVDAKVVDIGAVPKNSLSMSAFDHKQSVQSEVGVKLCRAEKAVSKCSAAVKCDVSGQSDKNKGDVRSRKSRATKPVERYVEYDVLSSSDNDSNAAESDKVLKCVKPAVKKSENRCGNKSKSVCVSKNPVNVESALFSLSDSDSDEFVATKLLFSNKARAAGKKSFFEVLVVNQSRK